MITRRVRPGCEAQYQEALRKFFQDSFAHDGVLGASMIVPPPGSGSREFGILRTFASARDRDAFYASALFREWNQTVAPFAEEDWTSRQLHGMEAWFRSPRSAPARWKMALLTWAAVWPATLVVRACLHPWLGSALPAVVFTGVVTAGVVALLTWGLMPLLVRAAERWLQPPAHPQLGEERRYGRE
ncbi:MAG TPA: antibiotic biosynthesis monooxygenase [Acidobacteriota bacterium]|nr:antibiotic biosynthesis monooxygenase [Acidobacteriota bacterium]